MSAPADLYVRDGSRFVLYSEARQHTPPIPEPRRHVELPVDDDGLPLPSAEHPVVEVRPGAWRVYAPICPHGHYRGCRVRGCPGPS